MTANNPDNSLLRTLAIRFGFVTDPLNDDTTTRNELMTMADDGCPNATGNTKLHDLSAIWARQNFPSKN